jgi:hypothetical protein
VNGLLLPVVEWAYYCGRVVDSYGQYYVLDGS